MKELENGQNNGQANGRLSRSQHNDKDRIDLTIHVSSTEMGEGYVVNVGTVQDQLDAHEDSDRIAPGEDSVKAEGEKNRPDIEIVMEADRYQGSALIP